MTRKEIEQQAEHFFEWPTNDRSSVTYTSALLFAEHCVREAINGYYEMLPEKSYVANRVKSVRDAVLKLYKDTGAKIDDDTINHVTNTWNQTMWALSGRSPVIEAVQLQKGGSGEA